MAKFGYIDQEGCLDDTDENCEPFKSEEAVIAYAKKKFAGLSPEDQNGNTFEVVKIIGVVKQKNSPVTFARSR
jgi:hypothetical protein